MPKMDQCYPMKSCILAQMFQVHNNEMGCRENATGIFLFIKSVAFSPSLYADKRLFVPGKPINFSIHIGSTRCATSLDS